MRKAGIKREGFSGKGLEWLRVGWDFVHVLGTVGSSRKAVETALCSPSAVILGPVPRIYGTIGFPTGPARSTAHPAAGAP